MKRAERRREEKEVEKVLQSPFFLTYCSCVAHVCAFTQALHEDKMVKTFQNKQTCSGQE